MSTLQEQAVQMVYGLAKDDLRFLIKAMQWLMPQTRDREEKQRVPQAEKELAFQSLNAARSEIRKYLPADFNPNRILERVRLGWYGDCLMAGYREDVDTGN